MPPASQDNNPQAGQGRPLPKKENDAFKNVVKFYEQKQYKKAVKQADLILKKYPNHGETLAMKGLVLNNMNKKEEAHSLVKQGLMNDMRCVIYCFVLFCTINGKDTMLCIFWY
jgi:N-alpha-acetyltransferase 15/16, NatA auxiliary subunit